MTGDNPEVLTVVGIGGDGWTGLSGTATAAADRRLWEAPDPDTLAALRQVYLETEGDLEGDEG